MAFNADGDRQEESEGNEGFNDKRWWDRRGTPHTEQLHIIERWSVPT